MSKQKVLYFEGAGMENTGGPVGNCRIRTAFSADNSKRYYLELNGLNYSREWRKYHPEFKDVPYIGGVDFCFEITGDSEDVSKNRMDFERKINFPYTLEAILNLVNEKLGCSFEEIKVLPFLSGYYVHGASPRTYNFADEFKYDKNAYLMAEEIKKYHYRLQKDNGEKHPCVSVWRASDDNRTLYVRHPKPGYPKETYRYSTILKDWVCICSEIRS